MPLPTSPMGCPMDALLRLLMGPWTSYILWALRQNGPSRFGALKRAVTGVSAKVLTERLKMLEQAGVIYRRYEPKIPPEVTYGLTPRGHELEPILDSLNALALRWKEQDGEAPESGEAGKPAPRVAVHAASSAHPPGPAAAAPRASASQSR